MNSTSKINVMLILLLVSIGINIYSLGILKKSNHTVENINIKQDTIQKTLEETDWSFCNNDIRFDKENELKGGQEIPLEDAFKKVDKYYIDHKDRKDVYKTTGFLFSKKVFDKIFSDENKKINTVRMDLVIEDDKLCLIAKGVNRLYTGINYVKPPALSSRIYINQSMCPNDCNYELKLY